MINSFQLTRPTKLCLALSKERKDRKEETRVKRSFHLSGERIRTLKRLFLFVFSAFSVVQPLRLGSTPPHPALRTIWRTRGFARSNASCNSARSGINEALSMRGLRSDGTDPLDDGLNASAGNSSHDNKSRWVGNHRGFGRRCKWKQSEQLSPKRILRLEFFSRLRHITDNGFSTLPFRKARYFLWLIVHGAQHRRAHTESLWRIRRGRIQKGDSELFL